MQQSDWLAATIRWIAQLRVRAAMIAGRWLLGGLLFLVALALRLDLGAFTAADPFATFYVSSMLIALACGSRIAGFFAVLSGVAGWFFFLRTPFAPGLDRPEPLAAALSLASFAAVVGLQIVLAEALARAAQCLTGDVARAPAPYVAALHRRAITAARFMAQPILSSTPKDAAATTLAAATASRLDALIALDRAVLGAPSGPTPDDGGRKARRRRAGGVSAAEEWAARMQAYCNAEIAAAGAKRLVCRISGDASGLDADQLLAVSLAICEMMREAIAARRAVFEVRLNAHAPNGGRAPAAGVRTLEIHTTNSGAATHGDADNHPWPDVTDWLARLLGASMTLSADDELAVRFRF